MLIGKMLASKVFRGTIVPALLAVLCRSGDGWGADTAPQRPALAGSPIALSLVPSRLSGVAPLAVFFDATGTTAGVTTRPFHDLEYRWDFGDPAGGATWNAGARPGLNSRNSATGPVAAHVFESPGTFTVSLTAFDGTNTASKEGRIVVEDPDVVFSGARTTCFSASGNFTGCPEGANHVTTSGFAAVVNSATPANSIRRLLLRRGEIFASAATASVTATGPGIIGAFGAAGAKPVIWPTGRHTILSLSSPTTPGMRDWRVMDLEFDGQSNFGSSGIAARAGINQVTLFRLNFHDIPNPISFIANGLDLQNSSGNPGHRMYDQIAVVDSNVTKVIGGNGSTGTFISATRFMYLGNTISDTTRAEHCLRTPYVGKGVLSNNTLSNPAAAKHVIQMHGPCRDGSGCNRFPTLFGNPISESTRYIVVSDNKFTGGGAGVGWTVYLGAQDMSSDERLRDIIVERNWFTTGAGTRVALVLDAAEATIRNNIIDMTGGIGYNGISVLKRGTTAVPDNVRVYNNTAYSGSVGGNVTFLVTDATATNVSAINNLAFAPDAVSGMMLGGGGAGKVTASNNSTNSQLLKLAPGWTLAAPTAPEHFKLGAVSPYVNAGAAIPVFSDFFRIGRPGGSAIDIGASEK